MAGNHTIVGTMAANKITVADTVVVTNLNADQVDGADKDTDTTMAANSDAKIPSQKAAKTYIDTKDAANAKLTGDQTVAGVKTFSSIPVLPASNPATDNQASRKAYVDGLDAANVKLTGNQTVAGIKTLSSIPVLPASDPTADNQATRKAYVNAQDALKANDNAVVKLTGNQTVAGIKTFDSIPVLPASDPTAANEATRKSYVNAQDALKADDNAVVKLTGNQTVAGVKTFSSRITGKGFFSSYIEGANRTQNDIFDILNTYIPNTGDEILLAGGFTVPPDPYVSYIATRAYRNASNQVQVFAISAFGGETPQLTLTCTDGNATVAMAFARVAF